MTNGDGPNFYLERLKLLRTIGAERVLLDQTISIDCNYNIITAFEKVSQNLESASESYACSSCQYMFSYSRKTVVIGKENLGAIEKVIGASSSAKCRGCKLTVELDISTGSQIVVDTSEATNVLLNDLPFLLNLGKQYILRGVVAYNGPLPNCGIGHYYAVCRRNDSGLGSL